MKQKIIILTAVILSLLVSCYAQKPKQKVSASIEKRIDATLNFPLESMENSQKRPSLMEIHENNAELESAE